MVETVFFFGKLVRSITMFASTAVLLLIVLNINSTLQYNSTAGVRIGLVTRGLFLRQPLRVRSQTLGRAIILRAAYRVFVT